MGIAAGGIFAFGIVAVAPVSVGMGAVGVVAIWVVSIGAAALGVAAAGGVGCGVAAVGAYAAKGLWVVAGEFATGTFALAPHANDAAAQAFFRDGGLVEAARVFSRYVVLGGFLGWVMPVVLTGWSLARRKT